METEQVVIYRTSDMKCAAALLATGHLLVDLENHALRAGQGSSRNGRRQRSKIKFVFEYSDKLHSNLISYAAGTLTAPIKSTYANLELVKSIIMNADFEMVDKASAINNRIAKV